MQHGFENLNIFHNFKFFYLMNYFSYKIYPRLRIADNNEMHVLDYSSLDDQKIHIQKFL